jgi:hypothetical protein
MMSDGRFAILGGTNNTTYTAEMSSCEALAINNDEYWTILGISGLGFRVKDLGLRD